MSSTITSPPPPIVETATHSDIVAAKTPLDVVNVILTNPIVGEAVQKYAGQPDGLPAAIAGLLVTGVVSNYALQLSPATVSTASVFVAAGLGYGWNWFSRRVLTPKTPVTK